MEMVQGEKSSKSAKLKLISLLPRLRRFAAVLAGDRTECDRLLRVTCETILAEEQTHQAGTPFDRFAFTQLYAQWLLALRDHNEPIAQSRGDEALFKTAFAGADASEAEIAETAAILTRLPPQQRSAILLIYGEGFSYEDAALILDAPAQTVVERAARALAALIERAGLMNGASVQGAQVQSLYPQKRRAG